MPDAHTCPLLLSSVVLALAIVQSAHDAVPPLVWFRHQQDALDQQGMELSREVRADEAKDVGRNAVRAWSPPSR